MRHPGEEKAATFIRDVYPARAFAFSPLPPCLPVAAGSGNAGICELFQRVLWQTRPVCLLWNLNGLEFCPVCFTLLAVKAEVHPAPSIWETWFLWFPSSLVCNLFRVGELRPIHPTPHFSI